MLFVQVVTDSAEIKKQLSTLKKQEAGMHISVSKNFKSALQKITKQQTDVFFIDLNIFFENNTDISSPSEFFTSDISSTEFAVLVLSDWQNPLHHRFVSQHIERIDNTFWYANEEPFVWNNKALAVFLNNSGKHLKRYQNLQITTFHNETLHKALSLISTNPKKDGKTKSPVFKPFFNSFFAGEACNTFMQENADTEKILLMGETGLQQDEIARYLHFLKFKNTNAPFIPLDFSKLPQATHEKMLLRLLKQMNDLFSHSSQEHKTAGTLYLSGIENLSWQFQSKLLKILHERYFIWEKQKIVINAFIIFAYFGDLNLLVSAGIFRQDLFSHLKTNLFWLSPVRKSPQDIEPFLLKYFKDSDKNVIKKIATYFLNYDCRGNVDELVNIVTKFLQNPQLLKPQSLKPSRSEKMDVSMLGMSTAEEKVLYHLVENFEREKSKDTRQGNLFTPMPLEEIEKEYIASTLQYCRGNISEASRTLGISRKTLYAKMNRYNIKEG